MSPILVSVRVVSKRIFIVFTSLWLYEHKKLNYFYFHSRITENNLLKYYSILSKKQIFQIQSVSD